MLPPSRGNRPPKTIVTRAILPARIGRQNRQMLMRTASLRGFGLFSLFSFLASSPAAATAADQPQWGQRWSRNMVSDERGLPERFDPKTGENIKWSARLGTETHSTPIVAGGRVFIGTNNGEPRDPRDQGDRGVLMCFDEKDGRFLWQLAVPKREEDPYFDWPKTGIASPVTVEGNRVYLVNNRGEVMCLDARGPAGETHPGQSGTTGPAILWRF